MHKLVYFKDKTNQITSYHSHKPITSSKKRVPPLPSLFYIYKSNLLL